MKKNFWIIFGLIVIGSATFVYRFFDQAIPLVRVSISIDSDQAQKKALELAQNYNWNVTDYNSAARFQDERELQAFVELEGGGKPAFIDMLEQNYYQPYQWHVRFYKEKEIQEIIVAFTPQGQPYEFCIKLPEQLPGEKLSKEHALQIAMQGASDWQVDMSPYHLVEHQHEVCVSGRIDHLFIYERDDISLGEGKYRIKLSVSGDQFTGLSRFVKIPDEFKRRYAQMYALNVLLASITRNVSVLLYLLIIGLFCFIFFYRRKDSLLFESTKKVLAGFALLLALSAINQWPLMWYCYQTHLSSALFMLQQLMDICVFVAGMTIFVGFIVLVSEAANRYVFGRHIQFFKLWTSGVAGSYTMLQQTMIGYGLAFIELGYVIAFSMVVQKLGWWQPLSTLIEPNILSTYIPFLTPITTAFQAGFFEEFLCRALPIAGVLLIAHNFKHKKYWFGAILVIQALIFATLHASYPQQPAYYRIVELTGISIVSGYLYSIVGLYPLILSHFTYDAILMLIPVFVSSLWVQKILAILIILIPLWIVLIAWLRQGKKFIELPVRAYNQAYDFNEPEKELNQAERLEGKAITRYARYGAIIFAALGLCLFFNSDEFEFSTHRVSITKEEAKAIAHHALEQTYERSEDGWTTVCLFNSYVDDFGNKFIWQKYGKQVYDALQGTYVIPPHYSVKLVKFDGPVEDRAEMFEVLVAGDGSVLSMRHKLPEYKEGKDISETKAQELAYDFINNFYNIDRQSLELVKCESEKHENRRDWIIVYKDCLNYSYDQGRAQITVKLAGDQLSSIHRNVHESEEWLRQEKDRMAQESFLKIILSLVIIGWCVVAGMIAIYKFGVSLRYLKFIATIATIFASIRMIYFINQWPVSLYHLSTTETFINQIINLISSSFTGAIMLSTISAGGWFVIMAWGKRGTKKTSWCDLSIGLLLGCGMYGCVMFCKQLLPKFAAPTALYGFLNSTNQILSMITSHFFMQMSLSMIIITMMFLVIDTVAQYYQRFFISPILFILASLALMGEIAQMPFIGLWLMSGLFLGFIWYLLYREFFSKNIAMLLMTVLVFNILQILPSAWYMAYPGIWLQFLISTGLAVIVAILIYRRMEK